MTQFSFLKTTVCAAVAAATFGTAGIVAAAPAQAASPSSSVTFSFGSGMTHNGVVLRFSNGHFANNYCLSDSEVRTGLRQKGFSQVRIIRGLGHHKVLAVGFRHSHWYQLVVDNCTGQVEQQQVRRSSNGSFSFTFNFGGYSNGGYGNGGYGDDHGHDNGGYGDGYGNGQGNGGGYGGGNGNGNGNGGGNANEEKVCLVTFFKASQVSAGADANVESARVLPRSVAEAMDQPNDRRAIFDYGTDAQTISTCNYLDQLN